MSFIVFHGSHESLDHIVDRIKHHRLRRDSTHKFRHLLTPQALIVDDDVESVQPLQIVLHGFGFETALAFDGKEALETIAKKNFDIVFLDINMPEMTGLEALQKVENLQEHDRRFFKRDLPLPIVTYSSYPMGDFDVPSGKNFFFAGHCQKPATLADLASLTGRIVDELGIRVLGRTKQRNEE